MPGTLAAGKNHGKYFHIQVKNQESPAGRADRPAASAGISDD
jgi:hypothetical protein